MYKLEELSIELSNRCLLRCIHCSSGSQPMAMPNELSHFKIFKLISHARQLGATVLSLSGGDPILLGMDVVSYVDHARSDGYRRVLFYTTGIWNVDLDQLDMPGAEPLGGMWGIDSWPYLEHLIDAGIRPIFPERGVQQDMLKPPIENILTVIFSLHSHRPEVHDFIMGVSGSWYTTTGGILALVDKGVNVEVHMVPMKPNYKHISNVRDMCADMGVSKLSLLRFVPQTRGHFNRNILDISIKEFRDIQYVLQAEYCKKEHPVKMRPGCPIDFRHKVIGSIYDKPKSCHAGLDLILVRPDGSVHPCAAWKTLPDDANVRDNSLAYIWEHGAVFQALRDYHTEGYKTLDGPCSSCIHLDSCKGGCPAQKLHAYGKTLDAMYHPDCDPLCPTGNRGYVI